MEDAAQDVKMCSKCGTNPRADEDSTNPWCLKCRAKYQKEYQDGRLSRERSKGFAAGVDAAVRTLSDEFSRGGNAMLSCNEVAAAIQLAPRPQPREDRTTSLTPAL